MYLEREGKSSQQFYIAKSSVRAGYYWTPSFLSQLERRTEEQTILFSVHKDVFSWSSVKILFFMKIKLQKVEERNELTETIIFNATSLLSNSCS